jgi:hypothetical protein
MQRSILKTLYKLLTDIQGYYELMERTPPQYKTRKAVILGSITAFNTLKTLKMRFNPLFHQMAVRLFYLL